MPSGDDQSCQIQDVVKSGSIRSLLGSTCTSLTQANGYSRLHAAAMTVDNVDGGSSLPLDIVLELRWITSKIASHLMGPRSTGCVYFQHLALEDMAKATTCINRFNLTDVSDLVPDFSQTDV
jgi:hypothetical protein